MSFFLRPQFRTRKQRITIYGLVLLEVIAINFIIPSSSSTGEVPVTCNGNLGILNNNTCPAITFDGSASSATPTTSTTFTISATIIATKGDMLIVFTSSENTQNGKTGNVTGITDNSLDSFTQDLQRYTSTTFCCDSETWHTIMGASSETVTVTWTNILFQAFTLVILAYKNANSVGAKGTSACGSLAGALCSGNLNNTLILKKTGSVVVGSETWEIDLNCNTNWIVPGNNQTTRGFACGSVDIMGQDAEDNLQASYSNGFPYFYNNFANSNPSNPQDYTQMAIEILPSQFNGVNVGLNDPDTGFCSPTGATCHINFASRASGPTVANQALTPGTAYCTGITTSALTISGSTIVELSASYTGASVNTTGVLLLIQAELSSGVPSQTFGAGACATGNSVIGGSTIYFATSGALSTSTEYSTSIYGTCLNTVPCNVAGTVYGWLEITPYNSATGVKFDQLNLSASPLRITIAELK